MVKDEYIRFLKTLITDEAENDVLRIANLVLQNIETLIPLTTGHGQRIKKIVDLAKTHWVTISADIQFSKEQKVEQYYPVTQLKSLSVGPFRGFAKQEGFTLASQLVLIYGPNGTGKSCFCEALEYCLLGNVIDAYNKRFPNQEKYLTNAHTGKFVKPILIGVDKEETDALIDPNETIYRFCFIEKNRIDNFSRIAAQTPAKQTEIISTLFGLDDFAEFVRNFTVSMDDYIDLEGELSKVLDKKREELSGYRQNLDIHIPKYKETLDEEDEKLANRYKPDYTFKSMDLELNGSTEQRGLIVALEAGLRKPVGSESEVTLDGLKALERSVNDEIQVLVENRNELTNASQEISYKQLFNAVLQVKEDNLEQCPVCQTPLLKVAKDPYIYAEAELEKLQHLGELQESTKVLETGLINQLQKVSKIIYTCCSSIPEENPLSIYQIPEDKIPTIDW